MAARVKSEDVMVGGRKHRVTVIQFNRNDWLVIAAVDGRLIEARRSSIAGALALWKSLVVS